MPQILSMEGKEGRVERASKQSMFTSVYDWFSSLHKFDRLFILIALLIIVATPTIVSNYQIFNPEAARGGGGTFTVSVSPNPAPYGTSAFVISGTGYKANSVVSVAVGGMLCCGMVSTSSDGSFSYTWNRTLLPDTYTVGVARLRGNNWVPAATTTFTVTP